MIENDDMHEPEAEDGSPASGAPPLEATIVEHAGRPDECTIYPADAGEDELLTTWIIAEEGAFVALDDAW